MNFSEDGDDDCLTLLVQIFLVGGNLNLSFEPQDTRNLIDALSSLMTRFLIKYLIQ